MRESLCWHVFTPILAAMNWVCFKYLYIGLGVQIMPYWLAFLYEVFNCYTCNPTLENFCLILSTNSTIIHSPQEMVFINDIFESLVILSMSVTFWCLDMSANFSKFWSKFLSLKTKEINFNIQWFSIVTVSVAFW